MPKMIDKAKLLEYLAAIKPDEYVSAYGEAAVDVINHVETYVNEMPTIEPEVRHGKGCSYCKGRSYSKKPLTVITRTMKRVEVVFEYCPACGRKMNGGAEDAGTD